MKITVFLLLLAIKLAESRLYELRYDSGVLLRDAELIRKSLAAGEVWRSPAHLAAIKFEETFRNRVNTYNLTVGGWLISSDFKFTMVGGVVLGRYDYLQKLRTQGLKLFTREIQHARFDNNGTDLIVKHVVDGTLYQYNFVRSSNPAGFTLLSIEKSKGLAEDAAVDFEDKFEELAINKGIAKVEIYFTPTFFFQEFNGKRLNIQQFLDKLSKREITEFFQYPKNPHFDKAGNLIVVHDEEHVDYEFTYVPNKVLAGGYQISQIVPAGQK